MHLTVSVADNADMPIVDVRWHHRAHRDRDRILELVFIYFSRRVKFEFPSIFRSFTYRIVGGSSRKGFACAASSAKHWQ